MSTEYEVLRARIYQETGVALNGPGEATKLTPEQIIALVQGAANITLRSYRQKYFTDPDSHPRCPICDRPNKKGTRIGITPQSVQCLREIAEQRDLGHSYVKLWQDRGGYKLPDGSEVKSKVTETRKRMQEAVYFGLLDRTHGRNTYSLTENGDAFLKNRHAVPAFMIQLGTDIIAKSPTEILMVDVALMSAERDDARPAQWNVDFEKVDLGKAFDLPARARMADPTLPLMAEDLVAIGRRKQ